MDRESKSDTEYEMGGIASNSSTSSGAGSERNLVPPRERGRMEVGYGMGVPPVRGPFVYPDEDSISLHSAISPQVHKKTRPKFFMGPSSPSLSHSGFLTPNRFSPAPSSPALSITSRRHGKVPPSLLTQAILGDMAGRSSPYRGGNPESAYDNFLQVPGYHPWCIGDKMCASCQLKEEVMSTCSSINPPPTFTALDNYRPHKPKQSCSCNAVFIATMVLSVLVLVLIGSFILYIEMVVRRTEYIPDPM